VVEETTLATVSDAGTENAETKIYGDEETVANLASNDSYYQYDTLLNNCKL
jgi:hypothetical protein